MPTKFFLIFPIFLLLTACNQGDKPVERASSNNKKADFVGCYSVEKGSPAQILIKADNANFSMQMKEPTGGWDSPEPLVSLDKTKAWEFFKTNALDLNQSDVLETLGRTDDVLALSQVKTEVSSLNPHLDSPYVVSLFGAVNTIYKVACDDVGIELAPKDGFHELPNAPKTHQPTQGDH